MQKKRPILIDLTDSSDEAVPEPRPRPALNKAQEIFNLISDSEEDDDEVEIVVRLPVNKETSCSAATVDYSLPAPPGPFRFFPLEPTPLDPNEPALFLFESDQMEIDSDPEPVPIRSLLSQAFDPIDSQDLDWMDMAPPKTLTGPVVRTVPLLELLTPLLPPSSTAAKQRKRRFDGLLEDALSEKTEGPRPRKKPKRF